MSTENNNNLRLVHSGTRYRMTVPRNVERKIRLLCREIHDVEWSGVLFYKVSGSFEDNSLAVICVDIFQMDEGSSGYTEYDVSPDVSAYMVDHPELLQDGVYQGLIHSHNLMTTFFSGTDTSTLLSEGSDMNHFVSLIVNNAGVYTAGITRRITSTIHKEESYEFPSWNDTVVHGVEYSESEDSYVQWFNLDIEVDRPEDMVESEILSRIKEVRNQKSAEAPAEEHMKFHNPFLDKYYQCRAATRKTADAYENEDPSLFDDTHDSLIDYSSVRVDDKILDLLVKQTLTCSVLINPDKMDVGKWVASMDSLFGRRFPDIKLFEDFTAQFVDLLINLVRREDMPSYINDCEINTVLAYNVRNRLKELPKNKWIDIMIDSYNDYL